mmetsp:Transcript_1126/g.1126  ORF Transcript_1126/g.1126 Transcript_1126/m.1126 type:complete len:150 (+) Transcript_1126:242-691(+)
MGLGPGLNLQSLKSANQKLNKNMIKLKEIQQSITNYPNTSINNTAANNTFSEVYTHEKPDFLNNSYVHQHDLSSLKLKGIKGNSVNRISKPTAISTQMGKEGSRKVQPPSASSNRKNMQVVNGFQRKKTQTKQPLKNNFGVYNTAVPSS